MAWIIFRRTRIAEALVLTGPGDVLYRFLLNGWGFDWLYRQIFVRPYRWFAEVNRDDAIDIFYNGIAAAAAGTTEIGRSMPKASRRAR